MIRAFAVSALLSLTATISEACAQDTPCAVGARDYYIAMPEKSAPIGAVMYLHGWGGTGKGALRNARVVDGFLARGYAVIAPDGVPREGRNGRSWRFHPASSSPAEEVAFLEAVADDAIARFDLPSSRIILSGFSIGGSMAAYAACLSPDAFAAYAPIGGNFWRPHPLDCAGPVRMIHTHGWTDTTVPLEGRVVNRVPITDPEAFAQGDIFYAMQVWRKTNGCVHLRADRFVTDGPYMRRAWDRCDPGSALELAIFPGGHQVPTTWPDLILDWFEGLD